MNTGLVEKIATAVLYEGYILYPYRASSVKNRLRFNFGVLYPREYCALQLGAEAWEMRTECVVQGSASTTLEAKIRFLHLAEREQWQEGQERDVCVPGCALGTLIAQPLRQSFTFEGDRDCDGRITETLEGEWELRVFALEEDVFKVALSVRNLAGLGRPDDRDRALLRSLVSVHSILQVADGEFASSLDPSERLKSAVATCSNLGTWPVLAGNEGQKDLILSAPIILYDYPQTAPESPGDLFDGCEIDEILALRILTMTDAEKLEVRSGDERARQILERTETMQPEHFQKLHGAIRGLRVSAEGPP